MTRATFLIAAVLTAIMAGCQDGNIMDPVTKDSWQSVQPQKAAPSSQEGEIPIATLLRDPANGFNNVYISGLITYEFAEDALLRRSTRECHIVINAELWPTNQERCGWTVSGESSEKFSLDAAGTATFTRRYNIQGRNDGVFLRVVYRATIQKLELQSISLERIGVQPDEDA